MHCFGQLNHGHDRWHRNPEQFFAVNQAHIWAILQRFLELQHELSTDIDTIPKTNYIIGSIAREHRYCNRSQDKRSRTKAKPSYW